MTIDSVGSVPPLGMGIVNPAEMHMGPGTVSMTMLGPSANTLTSSDLSLITAATGATFQKTSQGLQMVQYYNSSVPISSKDYAASLQQVEQDVANNHESTNSTVVNSLALGNAEFGYAENFTNSIISLRESLGPDQSISPLALISAAKQSNAGGATIPEDYISNAIGYLNGIGLSSGTN